MKHADVFSVGNGRFCSCCVCRCPLWPSRRSRRATCLRDHATCDIVAAIRHVNNWRGGGEGGVHGKVHSPFCAPPATYPLPPDTSLLHARASPPNTCRENTHTHTQPTRHPWSVANGAPGSDPLPSVATSVAGGGIGGQAPSMMPMPTAGSAPPSAPPSEMDEDDGVPQDYICPLTLEVRSFRVRSICRRRSFRTEGDAWPARGNLVPTCVVLMVWG